VLEKEGSENSPLLPDLEIKMCNLYKDKNWLYQKYVSEKLSAPRIAKICQCGRTTINAWLKRHGIEIRNLSDAQKGELSHWWKKSLSKEAKKKISKSMTAYRAKTLKPKIYHDRNWLYKMYVKKKLSSSAIAELCDSYNSQIWYWIKKFNIRTRTRSEAIKEIWSTDRYLQNVLTAFERKPTQPEIIFDEMTPETVVYTGNRTYWEKLPNGKYKNPDFKVIDQNKVIEVFGDYWHRNDDPQELIDLYKQIGFDCLVIWEKEIKETPQLVAKRVGEFIS